MYHHPHYPPPLPQQQNNQDNQLSRDFYNGAEILIIVMGIIWTLEIPGRAHVERCDCPTLELVEEELNTEAEADPAGPTCAGWLSVMAGFPGVDPAFHVLLAHQMRKQSPVSCWLFGQQFRIRCESLGAQLWATLAPLTFFCEQSPLTISSTPSIVPAVEIYLQASISASCLVISANRLDVLQPPVPPV